MRFQELPLAGTCLIEQEPLVDDRGFFGRSFCRDTFERQGLCGVFCQQSISRNTRQERLQGRHYQAAPHEKIKLIRCARGKIFDVIVDLRRDSFTYGQWCGVELSEDNHLLFYVPPGFAHGFQTLRPDSELFYQMSKPYSPESSRGFRWNDPDLAIGWPDSDQAFVLPGDAGLPFWPISAD